MLFLRAAAVCLLIYASSALAQTNGILREVYYNINGNAVANL